MAIVKKKQKQRKRIMALREMENRVKDEFKNLDVGFCIPMDSL